MVCIYCDSNIKTRVINSRVLARTFSTWRRRECAHCGSTITTREHIDYQNALRVEKNGSLEAFLRDKLFLSVHASLSHRKTALSDATQLTDTIINSLLKLQSNGVLARPVIIETATNILKRFDRAASVHYQAHHS